MTDKNTQALLERLRADIARWFEGGEERQIGLWDDETNRLFAVVSPHFEALTRERDAMAEALRSIAETQWDSGAADACVAMIRSDARSALTANKPLMDDEMRDLEKRIAATMGLDRLPNAKGDAVPMHPTTPEEARQCYLHPAKGDAPVTDRQAVEALRVAERKK